MMLFLMNIFLEEICIILDFGHKQHVNFYMAPLKVFITENVIAYNFTSLIICVFLVLTKSQDLCQITDTQGN